MAPEDIRPPPVRCSRAEFNRPSQPQACRHRGGHKTAFGKKQGNAQGDFALVHHNMISALAGQRRFHAERPYQLRRAASCGQDNAAGPDFAIRQLQADRRLRLDQNFTDTLPFHHSPAIGDEAATQAPHQFEWIRRIYGVRVKSARMHVPLQGRAHGANIRRGNQIKPYAMLPEQLTLLFSSPGSFRGLEKGEIALMTEQLLAWVRDKPFPSHNGFAEQRRQNLRSLPHRDGPGCQREACQPGEKRWQRRPAQMQGTKRIGQHSERTKQHVRPGKRLYMVHRNQTRIAKGTATTDLAGLDDHDLSPSTLQCPGAGYADDAAADDGDIRFSQAPVWQFAVFS